MIYTPKMQTAIKHFMDTHDAKLNLSTFPNVYFRMPDGTEEKKHITHLLMALERYRKDRKKKSIT